MNAGSSSHLAVFFVRACRHVSMLMFARKFHISSQMPNETLIACDEDWIEKDFRMDRRSKFDAQVSGDSCKEGPCM